MKTTSVSTRRRFVQTAGAALSATAAAAVAASPMSAGEGSSLEARLAALEDTDAIRRVHLAYLAYVNDHAWEEALTLFADDAEVRFAGGAFAGREHGIRRLFVEHFGRALAEGRPDPVPTQLLAHAPHLDVIDVAADRRTATAAYHCTAQVSAAIAADCTIAEMAIQQGDGSLRWQDAGRIEAAYVREEEGWRIARLDYGRIATARSGPPLPPPIFIGSAMT